MIINPYVFTPPAADPLGINLIPSESLGDFIFTRSSTKTYKNNLGVLTSLAANEPSITDAVGLLMERSSTNLVTYSNDFSNASFSKLNVVLTPNSIASPSESVDAFRMECTASGECYIRNTTLTQTTATVSIFAKKGEVTKLALRANQNAVWSNIIYDLDLGTVESIGAPTYQTNVKIEHYNNGWYRCSATLTSISQGDKITWMLSTGSNTYSVIGNGLYLYGFQSEVGLLTSYIPTSGATATRNVENITFDNIHLTSLLPNAGEASFIFDFSFFNAGSGGGTGWFYLYDEVAQYFFIYHNMLMNGSPDFSNWIYGATNTLGNPIKFGFTLSSTEVIFYANGVLKWTIAAGTTLQYKNSDFLGLVKKIMLYTEPAAPIYGLKAFKVYKQKLDEATMLSLTV